MGENPVHRSNERGRTPHVLQLQSNRTRGVPELAIGPTTQPKSPTGQTPVYPGSSFRSNRSNGRGKTELGQPRPPNFLHVVKNISKMETGGALPSIIQGPSPPGVPTRRLHSGVRQRFVPFPFQETGGEF
eukprot:scaffold217_cov341-Pavlova_lutheri.AAC.14